MGAEDYKLKSTGVTRTLYSLFDQINTFRNKNQTKALHLRCLKSTGGKETTGIGRLSSAYRSLLQYPHVFLQILKANWAFSPAQDQEVGDQMSRLSIKVSQNLWPWRSKQNFEFSSYNTCLSKNLERKVTSKKKLACLAAACFWPHVWQHWSSEKSAKNVVFHVT